MVQIITGVKGEGKTKKLLDHVHKILETTDGNVVYLDKSAKNIHELDNRVRLINVSEYPLRNTDQFIGFISGICSQDYDLQEMYLDGFLNIAKIDGKDLSDVLTQLDNISKQFSVNMVLSISVNKEDLPEFAREMVI
ncbi:MAG: twitching motility protein PilT [Lachnospiraceae bacterium]|nr:twitching motility protein PilT [Lachnospiraceae bacterium]MCD8097184.1 twitching motility protein PilT [Lachnospiraceae bacterium]